MARFYGYFLLGFALSRLSRYFVMIVTAASWRSYMRYPSVFVAQLAELLYMEHETVLPVHL